MLFLLFRLGKDQYALETGSVVEVLPLVHWKTVPGTVAGVAGVFNYHGSPVPLIDLRDLALSKPSRRWMSTRIIVVEYTGDVQERHLLGLLAERATETIRRSEEEFFDSGISVASAPYLGSVTMDDRGIIQRVEVKRLLPPSVLNELFQLPLEPL